MPLKKAMVSEVDEVRGVARVLGVINTVVFEGAGEAARRIGYNTDVAGIVNALRNAGASDGPAGVILGGGGTAAAAVAALQELGAVSVDLYVRNTARAEEAKAAAAGLGMDITVHAFDGAVEALAGAGVVISTLPPRAADGMAAELEALGRRTDGVLLDVAYDPWPSRIAAAWHAGGGTVVPGLEMLLYQAVEQVRHFTGLAEAGSADVIDVMCDAVGAPRRVS
jgi:shikimate dehydrogenase